MSATGDPGEAGFTLFEALVTLAILALISGIMFPAIERMTARERFAVAAGEVGFALREAGADAIRGGSPVALTASADGRTLVRAGRDTEPLGAEMTLSLPSGGLVFFPDGTSSGGAVLLSAPGRARRFLVDPLRGIGERG